MLTVVLLLTSLVTMSLAASEETEPTPEPTGILKVLNDIISFRENGGAVTRAFGTVGEGELNGNPVKLYSPEWISYLATLLLLAVFSYFVGSINFGVIVSKKMCKDDVRKYGSKNAGMTNVARVYGKKPAALTFLGDAGKGFVCALLGLALAGNGGGYLAVAVCMIGHAYPCFFGFKGGKCVSTACGAMLVLEPIAFIILMVCFLSILFGTKYVSLSSVISASLIPIFVHGIWSMGLFHTLGSFDYFIVIICSVFYACFIVWLHRANLKRLAEGTESQATFLFKKKEKT